ncbi:hypothetical protein [Nocardia cyriacigeorgica]|uniref:hypothetical protein n=1 Tax=Nocardia cyriacigeorgica TaxID=135487 RepID=UPI001895F738|nr:hypothetical protein [Nocardia cyriacigeorgica]MBF6412188.1 hypothetical protein [Nocardia cyriacigeorgica]
MAVETIAVDLVETCSAPALRFHDIVSGCDFTAATPDADPRLWDRYLRGALDVYRHFRVESALEYDAVADGRSTTLFFTATDRTGAVVAGVRVQGPYLSTAEVGSLAPWTGRPGERELRAMVARRIPRGVVESRGAWVARDVPNRRELGAAISRCIAHTPRILGVRYGFATVASFTTGRHRGSGGVAADLIPAVPYPDDRYQTVPIWWDSRMYRMFADRLQYLLMCDELRDMGVADGALDLVRRGPGRRSESRFGYGR